MNAQTTPVIVAIGELSDRPEDPAAALEPLALMSRASRLADEDGGGAWLRIVDSVDIVHQRSWRYEATAAQLCDRLGITPARAVYGPYGGESPVRMIDEAARRIEAGTSGAALIVAGEAQHARNRAERDDRTLDWTLLARREENAFDQTGVVDPLAAAQGVLTPAQVYPLFETAFTARCGETQAEGIARSASLWARYAERAAASDLAWRRDAPNASAIADPSAGNRLIAWPYTKAMVANPDVNQAAALIVTSLAEARARRVDDERIVFVQGGAFATEPRNWLMRDSFDRSPAQTAVLDAMAGEFDLFELYSCFPVVAKMAGELLGERALAAPTVTGGLSFFGAPLNGYMLHAATAMVRALRGGEGARGLLYGQGEYVTKHHALALGREAAGLGAGDVNAAASAARGAIPALRPKAEGLARVEAHTVVFDRSGAPQFGAVVARGDEGWRTLARTEDPAAIELLLDPGAGPVGRAGSVSMTAGRPQWRFA